MGNVFAICSYIAQYRIHLHNTQMIELYLLFIIYLVHSHNDIAQWYAQLCIAI